jgi:hypothetical protein
MFGKKSIHANKSNLFFRAIVEKLLEMNMHDVLVANDQLKWSMANRLVLEGFSGSQYIFLFLVCKFACFND